MKIDVKVVSLAIIFGLLPLALNTLLGVGEPPEFKTWFQLTLIYTLWFIGLYKLLFGNNHAPFIFLAFVVTIGMSLTPLGENKNAVLMITNLIYTALSVFVVGYITDKKPS